MNKPSKALYHLLGLSFWKSKLNVNATQLCQNVMANFLA